MDLDGALFEWIFWQKYVDNTSKIQRYGAWQTPLVDTDAVSGNAGIAGTGSVTRIQPCMKDWNDVLVHRAEIPNRNYFKSIVLKEPSKPETVKILRIVSRT